jgi:predicted dehydrogenase
LAKSGQVNVAIVGLGFGAEFIPIYQAHPDASIHAICRRNETKLNELGDACGIAKRYTDYEKLLSDPDVDYVHINSPIGDHAPMSIAALQAGKHVMCTVPMATTIAACEQIVSLVKETGFRYMMAETVVHSREFLFIKEMYEKGERGGSPAALGFEGYMVCELSPQKDREFTVEDLRTAFDMFSAWDHTVSAEEVPQ